MGGFGKYTSMEGSKAKSHTPNENGPPVGRDISGIQTGNLCGIPFQKMVRGS